MFDIAWTEMLVIAIVTIVIVGPRDLPKVMKTIASIVAKARSFAGKFQADMDQLAREAELEELREQAKAMHAKLTTPRKPTDVGDLVEVLGDTDGEDAAAHKRLDEAAPDTAPAASQPAAAEAAPLAEPEPAPPAASTDEGGRG
ncbi:MAG: Sec-independent protein translocase protein TatB [Rhodothalassiaceae bacterium]